MLLLGLVVVRTFSRPLRARSHASQGRRSKSTNAPIRELDLEPRVRVLRHLLDRPDSSYQMRGPLLHVLRPMNSDLRAPLQRLRMGLLVGLDLLLGLLAVAFPILSRGRGS